MNMKISVTIAISLIILAGCIGNGTIGKNEKMFRSKVYLIYSLTCPHCKAMIKYIDSLNKNVSVIKVTDSRYGALLKKFNFSWDGGVPLLFAVLENNTLIVIQGYPAESQEKDGYFMGMDYELSMCESLKGEKIYENGKYVFCKLPNGAILGNKYAVDYLFSLCEKQTCKEIS